MTSSCRCTVAISASSAAAPATAFACLPETNRYVRGMIHWLGFKQVGIPYTCRGRIGGESKVNLFYLIGFMLNAVFSFSIKPLRMFSVFGACTLALTVSWRSSTPSCRS